jgi:hypothetical protein
MNDERDPILQALFAESNDDLNPEPFISSVMKQASNRRFVSILRAGAAVLVLLGVTIFLPFDITRLGILITQGLANELVSIGNVYAAWLLAPVNNVASLIVLCFKAVRIALKRARTATYAN